MNALYYKSINDEPAKALAEYEQAKKAYGKLFEQLTNHFNATAIFHFSNHGMTFYGISFNDYESVQDKELWTKPDHKSKGACRIRSSVRGKGNAQKLKALKETYDSLLPKNAEPPSRYPFYDSIGTNWGDILFSGLKWFVHEGSVYIATGLKLTKNVTEITGSEFSDAELAHRKTK